MPAASGLLRELRRVRAVFGPEAEARKRDVLQQLAGETALSSGQLAAYHEDLLFLAAFPGAGMAGVWTIAPARWETCRHSRATAPYS